MRSCLILQFLFSLIHDSLARDKYLYTPSHRDNPSCSRRKGWDKFGARAVINLAIPVAGNFAPSLVFGQISPRKHTRTKRRGTRSIWRSGYAAHLSALTGFLALTFRRNQESQQPHAWHARFKVIRAVEEEETAKQVVVVVALLRSFVRNVGIAQSFW